MRIAIVTQSYYPKPGGVTEVAHHTAELLMEKGHYVKIITTRYNGREPEDENVIRIGRNLLVPVNGAWVNVTAGIGLTKRLARIFDEENFDIIQTHCALVPTLPLLTLKAARMDQKIVGTFHAAAEKNLAYRIFQKTLNKRAQRLDRRIAVSESAMRFAARYFPGEYQIIPNGIDCSRFKPSNEPIDRYKDGSFNILYVGRMDKRKGVSFLLRAIPSIQKSLKKKVRLILVGEGKLRKMFCKRPLRMNGAEVIFVGRVPPEELPRYYRTADIFCSPAIGQESFGIVLLEAMASGTPVVASDISGYRNVITAEKDGLLVPPKDSQALAEAIIRLARDDELKSTLASAGREKALTFDWHIVVDMFENIFLETVESKVQEKTAYQVV